MTPTTSANEESRRRRVSTLEAAHSVFARYGYRKASMEAVARAAHVSRQTLYLHFPTKEKLFREMTHHLIHRTMESVSAALSAPETPLEQRLVRAFDEWMGQFLEVSGPHILELLHASKTLGTLLEEQEVRCSEMVAETLETSGRMNAFGRHGITPRQLADTIYATAEGLRNRGGTREAFVAGMTIAVRVLCLPFEQHPISIANR